MMDLVKTLHIAPFSFMSFYHQVFSYKVFNETMVNTSICLISCFPQWGFSRDESSHRLLLDPCRFMIE
jgi:hypothetical protein